MKLKINLAINSKFKLHRIMSTHDPFIKRNEPFISSRKEVVSFVCILACSSCCFNCNSSADISDIFNSSVTTLTVILNKKLLISYLYKIILSFTKINFLKFHIET